MNPQVDAPALCQRPHQPKANVAVKIEGEFTIPNIHLAILATRKAEHWGWIRLFVVLNAFVNAFVKKSRFLSATYFQCVLYRQDLFPVIVRVVEHARIAKTPHIFQNSVECVSVKLKHGSVIDSEACHFPARRMHGNSPVCGPLGEDCVKGRKLATASEVTVPV